MRRITAAQQIRSLELRIAKLEREAGMFDIFSKSNEKTLKSIALKVVSALMKYGIANSYSQTEYSRKKKVEVFIMVVLGDVRQGIQSKMLLFVELDQKSDSLKVYLKDSRSYSKVDLALVPNFSEDSSLVIGNVATIVKNSLRVPKQRQKVMGLYS